MGLILIEGNIGSGKTTLGRMLSEWLNVDLYEELTSDFTGELLKKFYNDKKNWAFELQVNFLAERFQMIYDAQNNFDDRSVMDRSIYGDAIFAEVLYEDGDMSKEQYRIYMNLLDKMLYSAQSPTLMIYLESSTDMLMKRIEERNRGNEFLIERDYIERLNNKYNEWFSKYNHSQKIFIDKDNIDLQDHDEAEAIFSTIELYTEGDK